MDFIKKLPIFFWICLSLLIALIVQIVFQENTKDNLLDTQGLALQLREKVGYPDAMYKEKLDVEEFNTLMKREQQGKVFVCMTTMPNRLAYVAKSFASVPDHFIKVLVLPNEFRNRTNDKYDESLIAELHHKHNIQILRPSKDFGPFTKSMMITDSVTSFKCGLDRTSESKDILITIDDDMQYSKFMWSQMISEIVSSNFTSIVVGHFDTVPELPFAVIAGNQGVAQPAKLWTSAWRGDVMDLWDRSPCKMDDDSVISFLAVRFGISLIEIPNDSPALQASHGLSKDRLKNLSEHKFIHDQCMNFLSRMPTAL